jgi:hypothetical protein
MLGGACPRHSEAEPQSGHRSLSIVREHSQVSAAEVIASCGYSFVEASPFRLTSVFSERLPAIVDVNGPETHDALRALWRPVHPSEFRPVVDEVSAGALDHSASNRVAECQTDFVPHVLPVSFQVVVDAG